MIIQVQRLFWLVDRESRSLINCKLLQTSWTAIFGSVAVLEALVLAWWAEKLYQVWTKAYAFVRVRLPWQTRVEVEAEEVTRPKRVRHHHHQAAIDARNE